jgi:hypothetical protein
VSFLLASRLSPQPTSWVWICSYLICIWLLGHWSYSHVHPLYIHWKIKLQKFFYVAIYVLVGDNCFLYSSKYHSLYNLMNSWALIPRGNSMHSTLKNKEAQPNVKMFCFLPPKPYLHLGNSVDTRQLMSAGTCRYCLQKWNVWEMSAESCLLALLKWWMLQD